MASNAEFKSIGGKTTLVRKRPGTVASLSSLGGSRTPRGGAESSTSVCEPGFKQRGILSEVVRIHAANEVNACQLGPDTTSTNRATCPTPRESASVGGFQISRKMRAMVTSALPTTQKPTTVEVGPKVVEVYAHAPGDRPRKVTVERQKRLFETLDIEDLLVERNISFRPPNWKENHWLHLEDFDNTEYDIRSPSQWLQTGIQEDGSFLPVQAKGLRFNMDGSGSWQECTLHEVDNTARKYFVRWLESDGLNAEEEDGILNAAADDTVHMLNRLQILFYGEDPELLADRIQFAFQALQKAQSRAKLNFFIDNMPTDDIQCLDVDQIGRILELAKNSSSLRDVSIDSMANELVREANLDFARTMNKIILIHQPRRADEDEDDLSAGSAAAKDLMFRTSDVEVLEEEGENHFERPVPWFALWPLPEYNFTEVFSNFCFASLYIKPEVVSTNVAVAQECQWLLSQCIYTTRFQKVMRLDQFRQLQRTTIAQMAHRVKDTWVAALQKIVLKNFESTGKGWFSIHEANPDTYRQGKMKKLLAVIRFAMQDTLRTFALDSVADFCHCVESFIPESVKVQSLLEVDKEIVERPVHVEPTLQGGFLQLRPPGTEPTPAPPPTDAEVVLKPGDGLFMLEVKMTDDKQSFTYSSDGHAAIDVALEVLDLGLTSMADVPQLDAQIVPQLFKTVVHKQVLSTVDSNDDWVKERRAQMEQMLALALPPLKEYLNLFSSYEELLQLDPAKYVAEFLAGDVQTEEIKNCILEHKELDKVINTAIPDTIVVGLFEISCAEIRKYLAGKYKAIADLLLDVLVHRFRDGSQAISDQFQGYFAQLRKTPKDIEGVTEMREYMSQMPAEIQKVKPDMARGDELYSTLEWFGVKMTNDDSYMHWRVYKSPKQAYDMMSKTEHDMKECGKQFLKNQADEQTEFDDGLIDLAGIIQNFSQYSDLAKVKETFENVESVNERLRQAFVQAKQFNSRETLFGRENTDYSTIAALLKEWEPFSQLWVTTHHFLNDSQKWMSGPFDQIDAKHCETSIMNGTKLLFKTVKAFEKRDDCEKVLEISKLIKAQIDEFVPNVPIVMGLRNAGMRERHWKQVGGLVGHIVDPEMEAFTLERFLEMGMVAHANEIADIGDRSGKELSIEEQLKAMKKAWESVYFDCSELYRTTETYILKGADEVMNILDEQVVVTQAMQFSPFNKPFKTDIEEWNEKLGYVSECLEQWLKVQRAWMYLQPIFDSADILKQLPTEGKKFKLVDSKWRQAMNKVHNNGHALTACTMDGLLDIWSQANTDLDMVQKGLDDYLETKRGAFARFYFLSNDELLEILSQTKDPLRVQPFLSKVFEAMMKLTFTKDLAATQMHSKEGEIIDFVKPVTTAGKNVEHWMTDTETQMLNGVREVIKVGVETYFETPRADWVLGQPGQVVLQASQVHWTAEVEEAIKIADCSGYYQQLAAQLLELVRLVRGNITKLQRMSIGSLVVIDVHAKDTVELLAKENISDLMSFEWISQLRYYWEEDDRDDFHLWVRMVQTPFPYGYEYLGNSFRLVITPLTDMCYMTLMGAQSLNLGGAPAGPAGTGKTETTKDLAKALAKQCVVFNCSPEMDYLMVGKFFKGLSSSGAWCCFDEFNRIFIEVLSVIAQQLLQLFSAKKEIASYSETVELEFDATVIVMKPTFNVFITMNPGYAGRSELPDNLAALFRPMAMMVPDYGMIGEISFYAFGFEEGRHLAKKMVTTFQLCSEQLSAQCHYDYGMRAVKTVIEAAGLNKRKYPDQSEPQILLRALRDVNVPKFLKDDLPLFDNIISDLFPGVERPAVDYGLLKQACETESVNLHLQAIDYFVKKQFELFDMIQVRHGMMLVGPSGSGKTECYRSLSAACSSLMQESDPDSPYQTTHVHILNPKAITQNQLYGSFDDITREWSDGVAAELIRNATRDNENPDHHWIMFDGPVDALWIESMNTVLDDNKKLCLVSGEIIALSSKMRMQFEVEDLEVASPATVSRCGMIYMEPESLGFDVFFDSWIQFDLPETFSFSPSIASQLKKLLQTVLPPTLVFVRKRLVEVVKTQDNNMIQSLFRLLDSYFAQYVPDELKPAATFKDAVAELEQSIGPLFFFCLIWSLGATCNGATRPEFSEYIWSMISEEMHQKVWARYKNLHIPLPPVQDGIQFVGLDYGCMLYDYYYSIQKKSWVPWMETIPTYSVPRGAKYEEIVVPSVDSVRLVHIFQLLVLNGKHVLCPGPTGTGKSVNIALWLQKQAPEHFVGVFLSFSAQTHVNQCQDQIDAKLEKRRRGVYGPPTGKKMVLFVDDLNMPLKEYFGAQPPIELLRQWHDHGGWYNRKELVKFNIIDVVMVSAMGPPGGGRTFITDRLKRHYSVTSYTELQEESIQQIFQVIGNHFFSTFDDPVQLLIMPMIDATISVFQKALGDLLPTPSKSHYLFNLRDIWKVFLGLCSLSSKKANERTLVVRCWCHEVQRVFGDRLTDQKDLAWLQKQVNGLIENSFNMAIKDIFIRERLVFANFMTQDLANRFYEEVTDLNAMKEMIEEYLEDYNQVNTSTMPLVMFLDACEHCSRSCRVLDQPSGNVLLLGVGGSGRQSLTRLSSYICEAECFQIQVAKGYGMFEFKEDLKRCLMKCGVGDKAQVFLFGDTQIVKEDFVEAINNILNSGDVPNLYAQEDFEAIASSCKKLCQELNMQPTKANLFAAYLTRVRKNIHVVLAFSPVGDSFRNRLRMFPSLVNCCTIDWFHEWPAEALYSVAKQQITAQQVELPKLEASLQMFQTIHQSVEKSAQEFFQKTQRNVYVTPTSYLELLASFVSILAMKRRQVGTSQHRYQVGLTKIADAEEQVSGLQEMLTEKKPFLEQTQKQVGEMMIVITKDKADAEEVSQVVAVEEAEAQVKASVTQDIKDDAQKDLDEALPALDIAVQCLKKLKADHIREVKALTNPPGGVRLACEAVCIMFGHKPVKKQDPNNPGKKIEDYWETSQKHILSDPKKLLEELFEFDKDNIPDRVINTITPYMEREDFDPAAIKKASIACEAICLWVRAMFKYHYVAKGVEPKRQLLRKAQEELGECQAKLEVAQSSLREVQSKIAVLEADFNGAVEKQTELQNDMTLCEVKLERAHRLIGGLGGEKARWGENVKQLTEQLTLLPGDCIVAAGMVSYAGPFTSAFRSQCERLWLDELTSLSVIHNPDCSMRSVLGEPVKIQSWVVAALPNDALSIENGIIIDRTRRWPLMIDPQRQANKYIKNMGKDTETGIDICKLTERNFLRVIELGIGFGKWILLENIGLSLDPALEPVLLQQKVRDGTGFSIKLGDKAITYNETFRFFMTTTLPNPHYSPETSVKVTLLNFAITPTGLEDQMLGICVAKERPDLEEQKNELVVQNAKMNKALKEIEDDILRLFATSEGDILEDDTLVDKVMQSKTVAEEIAEKKEIAATTEVTIDNARESYRAVAYRASVLFFCIVELASIDPMYQYSLQWFQQLFTLSVDQAPKSDVLEERLQILKDAFTDSLYQNVCRGLFERDKPLFSFALCARIMIGANELDQEELRYLLLGPTSDLAEKGPKVPAEWVGKVRWNEILTLGHLPAFAGFDTYFARNVAKFKPLYDAVECDKECIPDEWEAKLSAFQRLCFIRAFRTDNLKSAIIHFISERIGQKYVEPPTFDIAKSFADSINSTPLIFILSPGTDPVTEVIAFAEKVGMHKRFESISLGQGQGPKATKLIENAQNMGGWVLLSNCHLMESWMADLEVIVEQLNPESISNNFRLWLTSMPAKTFPVQVLQNGVKMTNEPPAGLRANILRSFSTMNDKSFAESNKPGIYRNLLFGFCFFHAVVQDRRKFGAIGWNIQYGFTPEDLHVCKQQLMTFINQYDDVPYKVLNFLGAQINYGGRVTDDKDKLLIKTIIATFICPEAVEQGEGYKYSASGHYFAPSGTTIAEITDYVRALPQYPMPEAFGLHENCNITCAQDEADKLTVGMQSMVSLEGGSEGGQSADDVMGATAASIQERLPTPFPLDICEEKFPTLYEDSMNTVVKQECLRYNKLLWEMVATLKDFRKALKGLVVMTTDLESLGKSLFVNEQPELWVAKGPLSLKPLTSWYLDILARCQFFQMWYDLGSPPPVFWISGIFFPQAFFTGAMQNFARRHGEEIDLLSYKQTVMDDIRDAKAELTRPPDDGVYIYGIFLEGARWSASKHKIEDSKPKELFTDLPSLWFCPIKNREPNALDYRCPCYKVVSRKGTLLTTGHSTNFVLYIELATDTAVGKWIKAGMAAFLALKF